jgi:hypothetical protein
MEQNDYLLIVDERAVILKDDIFAVFEEDVPMKPSKVRALEKLGRALDEYLEG